MVKVGHLPINLEEGEEKMIKNNRLTQISEVVKSKAIFLCECGNEKELDIYKVKSGHTKSCGCLKKTPNRRKKIEGQTFGRLKVIEVSSIDIHGYTYLCECSCGNMKVVKGALLRSGKTKSCGCINRDNLIERNTSHGGCGTPLYKTWCGIKARCGNPNEERYKDYGGRGIKVCERWINSFENFREDMGERPSKKHSIDRIDNDGDYSPENCKWSDDLEQVYNRRKMKNASSKYRGVSLGKTRTQPWISRICVKNDQGKTVEIYIGGFSSEVEAAKAYDAKVIELNLKRHINFPEEYIGVYTNILNKIEG